MILFFTTVLEPHEPYLWEYSDRILFFTDYNNVAMSGDHINMLTSVDSLENSVSLFTQQ